MRRHARAVRNHPGWFVAGVATAGAVALAAFAAAIVTRPVPWPNLEER